MNFLETIEWLSALLIPAALLFQIIRIYQHKEVRDLSLMTCVLFTLAYISLSIKAYNIDSQIFLLKNSLSLVLSIVLLIQRIYYKNSKWIGSFETFEKHSDRKLIEDILMLVGNTKYIEGDYTPMIRGILKHYSTFGRITSDQRNALITHYNNNGLNYRSVLA